MTQSLACHEFDTRLPLDKSAAISAALRQVADENIVTGCRLICPEDAALLHPVEAELVRNAVPIRVREFAAGRVLLRTLMGANAPIPALPSRRPQFPPGVVGSLAHDRTYCVAAVTCDTRITALGIDIEPAIPFPPSFSTSIVREDDSAIDARLAFVLKEATYKAWSALGGDILEFHDVRIRAEGNSFDAEVLRDGRPFAGRFVEAAGRYCALVTVTNE
jgi:4'-phosphopantetheinyl transferase EntD